MEDALSGGVYEIVIGAVIDDRWAHWFSDFEWKPDGVNTRLVGTLADQPALHGALARLRDLGLPIVAVRRISDVTD